ncbi:MAG: VTT domain-containing protein [Deltaproteobacteria bacterium]|nr:VTT domain-containing protein [Deltaproteobacteria bacterium]
MRFFRAPGHIQTVLLIELLLISSAAFFVWFFWDQVCSPDLISCLSSKKLSWEGFLLLSFFRPFLLTPLPVFAMMAGNAFGPLPGALLAAVGATLSSIFVYMLAKAVGKKLVNPWLASNLPQTLRFIRSQDWKIVLICRLIPVFPFDIMTFTFGLLDFRWKYVLAVTLIGIIPESYIFSVLATPDSSLMGSAFTSVAVITVFCLLPGVVIEFQSRKKGSSLWVRLKAMWNELNEEIRLNNDIVKHHQHDPDKIPVLLVYGYFSSRRALTVLERILSRRGYEVISFNLGGLLGVFFTRGIRETAAFIDFKLKRQFERHHFDQIHIIAHSKGGLVALWWLLKLQGFRHCQKLITMGTPYQGTLLTWLALVTPAGFLFRDLWQMRPGSELLENLREEMIPPGVRIYNFYSNRDRVASGENGIFRPYQSQDRVTPVPLHHVTHFEFLYRRDVGDALVHVLGSPYRDKETLRHNHENSASLSAVDDSDLAI